MKNTNCLVALTGGIGSGKSFALSLLEQWGYKTLSCDKVYEKIFETNSFKRKLKKIFPTAVKGIFNLKADRKEISRIVFSDKDKLAKLNALSHPLIVRECISQAQKMGGVVFVEVPLLFEGGFAPLFDKVIVVMRSDAQRIQSVMDRSNLTIDEVLSRMKNQTDYAKLDLREYIVVNNDENFKENLKNAVENI